MRSKVKGSRIERMLLDKLWEQGVAAVRIAGSGVSRHPSADIVAGYGGRIAIIEVKSTSKDRIYVPVEEVSSMRRLAQVMGGEAWIAAKFSMERGRFFMIKLEDARELPRGSVAIDLETAKSSGLSIEEFARRLKA